ncbi:MAG: flagellar biosynthesis anti-sigma factor FlgM [Gemmatimonadales bacterium]|nr:flagellar biosynthesis anti-sigma factor FlgM [Gemmatimonadales bacterium]
MSMNKIDGSQLIPTRQLDSSEAAVASKKSDATRDIPAKGTASDIDSEKGVKSKDTLEISAEARNLMETRQVYDAGLESVKEIPETRADKLAQVRSRLEEGFYNSTEVRDKVANGVEDTFRGIDEL